MTHDEMIAVIQAEKDGRPIECRYLKGGFWGAKICSFNFIEYEYRIIKKPMRIWVNMFGEKEIHSVHIRPEAAAGVGVGTHTVEFVEVVK